MIFCCLPRHTSLSAQLKPDVAFVNRYGACLLYKRDAQMFMLKCSNLLVWHEGKDGAKVMS